MIIISKKEKLFIIFLFFKRLRIKNNLVYDIYSNINLFYGSLTITTSFENSKKNLILKIIQEEINKLQSLKTIQRYQKIIIKKIKDNPIYKKDSKYYLYNLL